MDKGKLEQGQKLLKQSEAMEGVINFISNLTIGTKNCVEHCHSNINEIDEEVTKVINFLDNVSVVKSELIIKLKELNNEFLRKFSEL